MVLSFDRYSRDDVIGEVMVELDKIDMSASEHCPVPIAREITPRSFKVIQYSGTSYLYHYWTNILPKFYLHAYRFGDTIYQLHKV